MVIHAMENVGTLSRRLVYDAPRKGRSFAGKNRARSAALPLRQRTKLERLFNADLSAIRMVHTSALARTSLDAAACGDLVLLPDGMPDPASAEGIALVSHELAHCLQQRAWAWSVAGGVPVHVADPLLEEAADWVASCARLDKLVPPAVRDAGVGWLPGPATHLSRTDCQFLAALHGQRLQLLSGYLQARVAGGITFYGGDSACRACSELTVGTVHELPSTNIVVEYCRRLADNLKDVAKKSPVERTGSLSRNFNNSVGRRGNTISGAMTASSDPDLSRGYMLGILLTTDNTFYAACSGPSDSIPDGFDTGIAMTANLHHCKDDLDPQRLRTRRGRRIEPEFVDEVDNPPGNCAAPKLIQQCYADRKVPASMVEMFFGRNSPADGQVIESCETCKNLLPMMLCPNV